MKCLCCGDEAKYHVTIKGYGDNIHLDCLRCEYCTERAKRSYEDVEVSPLENENV